MSRLESIRLQDMHLREATAALWTVTCCSITSVIIVLTWGRKTDGIPFRVEDWEELDKVLSSYPLGLTLRFVGIYLTAVDESNIPGFPPRLNRLREMERDGLQLLVSRGPYQDPGVFGPFYRGYILRGVSKRSG